MLPRGRVACAGAAMQLCVTTWLCCHEPPKYLIVWPLWSWPCDHVTIASYHMSARPGDRVAILLNSPCCPVLILCAVCTLVPYAPYDLRPATYAVGVLARATVLAPLHFATFWGLAIGGGRQVHSVPVFVKNGPVVKDVAARPM